MDLSALIFVALAVAWAAYLIPKALKHHEEDQRHRTVDRFSSSMRVLATREPVDGRTARLVVPGRPAGAAGSTPASGSSGSSVTTEAVEVPVEVTVTTPVRRSTARAARRRRRVLGTVVLANLVVATLAAFAVVAWPYLAIPGGLLVAWLVACRLMVKAERGARRPVVRLPGATPAAPEPVEDDGPLTEEIAPITASVEEAEPVRVGWDPSRSPSRRTCRRSPPPAAASAPSTLTPPASGPPAGPRSTAPSPARPSRPTRPPAPPRPRPRRTAAAPPAPDHRGPIRLGSPRVPVLAFPSLGAVAQLVARLVRNEKVRGSNPLSSTTSGIY